MKPLTIPRRLSVFKVDPWLPVVALCLMCFSGAEAALNIKLIEFVNYPTGNLGNAGKDGWSGSSGNVTVTNGSGSLDGTSLGLLASQGDKVYVSGTDAFNTFTVFADASTFPTGTSNNLYYSFLYKFHTASFTNPVQRIIQVNRQNSSSGINFQGVARTNSDGTVQVGVNKSGGTVNWSPKLINPGQVAFVVYRHQITAGSGVPDIIDLWVNPAPASLGAGEPSVPAPDATATDGTDDSSNTGPGRLYVPSGADAELDELRISTNWADVTPPADVCEPAAVSDPAPATITVTADIRAKFSVVASGTSPAIQWQVSHDGGTTFSDISGGLGANYTTPPLATSDSGNQYRAVVHVICNNSYATSSVASVTVNPFTVTPPGVVLDDNWSDLDRKGFNGNGLVDSSNSVWYSSSPLLLDASGGQLLATPLSGNSVLWVGYFVPTNNTPVHLAVGSGIKVTLPFVATDIPTNSGNTMRFGLFDYSDGGLRITADSFGSGSTGNGINVLGYLLTQDWGTNFSVNSPSALSARTTLTDTNLMGASGDYSNIGSGPGAPLFLTNAPAFVSGEAYTLEFTVSRTSVTSTVVKVSFTGAGTNYTTSITDTNYFYHRFDAFAIRPATAETTASSFTFSRFLVEVISVPVPFRITSVARPTADSAVISWDSISGFNYQVQSRDSLASGDWSTIATLTASGDSCSYTNSGISSVNARFYRVVNTP